MTLYYQTLGLRVNDEKNKLNEKKVHKVGFAKDHFIFLFAAKTQDTFLEINFKDFQGRASFYQANEVSVGMGRGFDFGKFPEGKKIKSYDHLKKIPLSPVKPFELSYYTLVLQPDEQGSFEGQIKLGEEELAFSVEVLKNLPDENYFSLELWEYPYAVARYYGIKEEQLFKKEHKEKVMTNLRLYKEAGGNTIATTIVEDPWNHQTFDPYPSLVKWEMEDGKLTFDFSNFDEYVSWNIEAGIKDKIKSFSLVPWDNRVFYYQNGKLEMETPEIGSKRWEELWGQFIEAYITHLDKKGWFDITYLAMDERPLNELEAVIKLIHHYQNKDGKHLLLSGALNYDEGSNKTIEAYADVSIGQTNIMEAKNFEAFVSTRRKQNFDTTLYNCVGQYPSMFSYSDPQETAMILWYSESLGLTGFLRWALDAWSEDPMVSTDHWYWESGDTFLIYPNGDVSPRYLELVTTIENIRHYRYLKEKNVSGVEKIQKLLKEIHFSFGKENEFGARVRDNQEDPEIFQEFLRNLNQDLTSLYENYK